VFKCGGLNGSQTASAGGSNNEAAGTRIGLKDIARDIVKVIRADDAAERDIIGWNLFAVRIDIGKSAILRYVDTLHLARSVAVHGGGRNREGRGQLRHARNVQRDSVAVWNSDRESRRRDQVSIRRIEIECLSGQGG